MALKLLTGTHKPRGETMLMNTKKKNPLTKAQGHLLKSSLKRLLGVGLLNETKKEKQEVKKIFLKDALNALILD
jgi:hypothetical protein